jgi:hypothetical protein
MDMRTPHRAGVCNTLADRKSALEFTSTMVFARICVSWKDHGVGIIRCQTLLSLGSQQSAFQAS